MFVSSVPLTMIAEPMPVSVVNTMTLSRPFAAPYATLRDAGSIRVVEATIARPR